MNKIVELKTNVKAKAKALIKENPLAWSKVAINAMEMAILSNDGPYIRLALSYEEAIRDEDHNFAGTILKIIMGCLAEDHARGLQEHKDSVRYF